MRLLRPLADNLATLLLAFTLALLIWINARLRNDPSVTNDYQLTVVYNEKPDGVLLTPRENNVRIVVEGRQSIIDSLSTRDFTAIVDLSPLPFGEALSVPIEIQHELEGVEIVDRFPASAEILLDQLVTRDVPVQVTVSGDTAAGYANEPASIDPETVQITGPASSVERVVEARPRNPIFLDGTRESLVSTRSLLLYDAAGTAINQLSENLTLDANSVVITVPVIQLSGVEEKTVSPRLVGEPAEGFRFVSVNIEPSLVLVQGAPARLDQVRLIETEDIDITGLKSAETFIVSLDPEEGIELDDPTQRVAVEVVIEPITTSAIQERIVEVRNLSPDFDAILSDATVQVFMVGPLEVLDTLANDDVRVSVDLLGLDEGSYTLEPNISVADSNIEVRSISPSLIGVEIIVPPTPTPTPTSTPSPTLTPTPSATPTDTQSSLPFWPTTTLLLNAEPIESLSTTPPVRLLRRTGHQERVL